MKDNIADDFERDDAPAVAGDEGRDSLAAGEAQGLHAEMDELRGELSQLNDRHLRLAADFDNYRKRIERDRHATVARMQVDLVASLLGVLDDLERVAENGATATAAAVVEGVRLVEKKFLAVLNSVGVEPIEAEGQVFDPSVMEAMATVSTDDPARDEHVADVFQRGYRMGEVLVRPARVRVLKYVGPAEGSE
jgi:molecular chaperone GrpE